MKVNRQTEKTDEEKEQVVNTTCSSHCGGTCRLRVHVREGRITRIESDDGEEPQFRACLRGRAYRQRVYSPDRLKYPMKRTGERGEGKFKRVSWDEALETTAGQLLRVRDAYGPAAVFLIISGGDITWLHGGNLTSKVLLRGVGGYSTTWGWHSNGGAKYAALSSYGTIRIDNTGDDFLNSRLIIMWGWNPTDTIQETNTNWYLMQAREAGTRFISIDPRYTNSTASFAHQWIPIIPGTDAAMMIAMAYVIISENLEDRTFLAKYTTGFDKFKDYVTGKEDGVPKTPAWAEAITGVPADTTVRLAREYATTKPAALIAGIAPGRTAYGEEYHRVAIILSAMTGNVGIHGGNSPEILGKAGVDHYLGSRLGPMVGQRLKGGPNPIDVAPPRANSLPAAENFWKGWNSSSRVNRFLVADAILKGKAGGYPADYKVLYTVNVSYINQYSNINKMARALKKLEFVIAQEQFLTPTAKFADIIFPTNTYMERNDIAIGGATPFYGFQNKVIDPLYESKSHFEIACGLAEKLGVPDFSDKTEEEWLKEIVEQCADLPDYETFKKEGIHKVKLAEPYIPFTKQIEDPEHNPFPTPSGKIEIYSRQLADMNNPELPPVPKYIETWESRNDPLARKYPLQLISTHFKRRAHSQFDNIPWLRELQDQAIMISTADALARNIRNGDLVRVFNERGETVLPAWVTERILPGVVDIPEGAWYNPDRNFIDRSGCPNVLHRDAVSPGEAYPINTCLVQVEKAEA